MYNSLEDVLTANSVLNEGIDFFLREPLDFIELIKKHPRLAKDFAEHFTGEQIEQMLMKVYYYSSVLRITTGDIFFNKIIDLANNPGWVNLIPLPSGDEILYRLWKDESLSYYNGSKANCPFTPYVNGAFYDYVWVHQMDDSAKTRLLFYSKKSTNPALDKTNHCVLSLHNMREVFVERNHVVPVHHFVHEIVNILLKKIKTPGILDPEAAAMRSEYLLGKQPRTILKVPDLEKASLRVSTFGTLSRVLRLCSPEALIKCLTASFEKKSFFQAIIRELPLSKKLYDLAYATILGIAQGPNGTRELSRILHNFNFNILEALEKVKSKSNYAQAFYEIGEQCSDKARYPLNPMIERYPKSAPKYIKLDKPAPPPYSESPSSSSSSSHTLLFASLPSVASAPPPDPVPPPPYNSAAFTV